MTTTDFFMFFHVSLKILVFLICLPFKITEIQDTSKIISFIIYNIECI